MSPAIPSKNNRWIFVFARLFGAKAPSQEETPLLDSLLGNADFCSQDIIFTKAGALITCIGLLFKSEKSHNRKKFFCRPAGLVWKAESKNDILRTNKLLNS